MYTSIFNRLRAIGRKSQLFPTPPVAFNAPERSNPLDNRGKCHTVGKRMLHGSKENSMLVKRLAACTHLSSTVSEI